MMVPGNQVPALVNQADKATILVTSTAPEDKAEVMAPAVNKTTVQDKETIAPVVSRVMVQDKRTLITAPAGNRATVQDKRALTTAPVVNRHMAQGKETPTTALVVNNLTAKVLRVTKNMAMLKIPTVLTPLEDKPETPAPVVINNTELTLPMMLMALAKPAIRATDLEAKVKANLEPMMIHTAVVDNKAMEARVINQAMDSKVVEGMETKVVMTAIIESN
jgi:hypothetical protein